MRSRYVSPLLSCTVRSTGETVSIVSVISFGSSGHSSVVLICDKGLPMSLGMS